MGLDITAYRNLTKADGLTANEHYEVIDANGEEIDGYWEDYVVIVTQYTEQQWPGRTAPLEDWTVYSFTEDFGFRAGSYSGYSGWRNLLAMFAGFESAQAVWKLPRHTNGAFFEHISFTDADGVIGSVVAAKLAKDYAEWQDRAEKYALTLEGETGEWFIAKYNDWRKAFEMASDNGAVLFH